MTLFQAVTPENADCTVKLGSSKCAQQIMSKELALVHLNLGFVLKQV